MEIIIITGGSNGIGLKVAEILATRNPQASVVITGRSMKTVEAAKESIGLQNIIPMVLELSDFKSIQEFSAKVNANLDSGEWTLKALVNNAGIQTSSLLKTSAGIEKTFHVNHLGTFQLTNAIIPHVKNKCRVIVVSSNTHDPKQKIFLPTPTFKDPSELTCVNEEDAKKFNHFRAYTRRVNKDISVLTYDPGWIPETGLTREHGAAVSWVFKNIFSWIVPHFHGGSSMKRTCPFFADLIDSPKFEGLTNKYYDIDQEIPSSDVSYDEKLQERLWEFSVELLKKNSVEIPAFAKA